MNFRIMSPCIIVLNNFHQSFSVHEGFHQKHGKSSQKQMLKKIQIFEEQILKKEISLFDLGSLTSCRDNITLIAFIRLFNNTKNRKTNSISQITGKLLPPKFSKHRKKLSLLFTECLQISCNSTNYITKAKNKMKPQPKIYTLRSLQQSEL